MHSALKRLLAVGTTAAVAFTALTASAPSATAAEPSLTKAADYLNQNLPTADDGVGPALQVSNALAATGDCTYAPGLRKLVGQLQTGAKGYLYPTSTGGKLNQARAANLAITVQALGLNPRAFAGYDLLNLVPSGVPQNGQIGATASTFNQSLAIIAMHRGQAQLPSGFLTTLLRLQLTTGDNAGAFGYEFPAGTLNPDPDSTGLALIALQGSGQAEPQREAALAWAKSEQLPDGSWPNDFSPVDTTGVLGSAVYAAGATDEAAKATTWLGSQQLADGGFPATRNGVESNVMATSNAIWLLAKKTPLDVSLNLADCPTLPASTTACTGVWVVVDRGNAEATTRCATSHTSGLDALSSAGLTVDHDNGFVTRIQGFPKVVDTSFTKYWGYWTATPNADGTWSTWTSSPVGAGTAKPVKGSVQGWLYGPYVPGAQPKLNTPPRGYARTSTPIVNGIAQVGFTLTAKPRAWSPTPTFSYQWLRDGSAINSATKSTYQVTTADRGKTITVRVTGTKSGYQSVSRTSVATAKK